MSNVQALNADMNAFIKVDTAAMDWQTSPSHTVWRKRLHLYGPKESGQVTSIVRYDPDSSFPEHGHPEGEEILVLEGVFSDQAGDWGPGSYLLNPEGFRHAPFSKEGCVIFVKLRQYPGNNRRHIALATSEMNWEETRHEGRKVCTLYREDGFPEIMSLVNLDPDSPDLTVSYPDGAELLVVSGTLEDEHGLHGPGSWLRFPPGGKHLVGAEQGCRYYVKEAHLPHLRSPDLTSF
ncbi:MAG: cupin domain-containing protein [Acidobacteriota bacterium]|nr:cupin domain-containing protein [Acidobacteriota bacterium]